MVDPGRFGIGELVVRRQEGVVGDGRAVAVVIKVETLVEALVEEPPGIVWSFAVQLGRATSVIEAFGEALRSQLKLIIDVTQLALDAYSLQADSVAALLDLAAAELSVGGKIDEPFLANLELSELLGEGRAEFLRQLLMLGHGFT